LVVLGGVEDEFTQELSGGLVDHSDVAVLDEEQDVGSGVGSADADVVEAAVVAQGDHAGVVDAVAAYPVVGGRGERGRRGGLGSGLVGADRGAAA
jgi:hypothetical protein